MMVRNVKFRTFFDIPVRAKYTSIGHTLCPETSPTPKPCKGVLNFVEHQKCHLERPQDGGIYLLLCTSLTSFDRQPSTDLQPYAGGGILRGSHPPLHYYYLIFKILQKQAPFYTPSGSMWGFRCFPAFKSHKKGSYFHPLKNPV
jgi:hypothetical protein